MARAGTLAKLIYKTTTPRSATGKDSHARALMQSLVRDHAASQVQKLQDIQDDSGKCAKTQRGPKRLYLLYLALKRRHGQWVGDYEKDQRMRTCFKKLSKKFDELKAIGLDVNEVDYIYAHKVTYGDNLRPNHLISWCSLGIYQSYLTEKHAEKLVVTPEEQAAYDTEMVAYLMQVRGESKRQVVKLLESFDLL
jgi:hypothetical protein